MRRGIFLVATGAAVATWLFATLALATGDWWLECTQDGATLTGIDCLEALPGSARAASEPARWFGLNWLVVLWLLSGVAVPALVLLRHLRARRSGGGWLGRPEHPGPRR